MKKIFYTILLALGTALTVSAQPNPYQGQIRVAFPNYEKHGQTATFRANVDYSALRLSTQQMIELTPVLRSTVTDQEQRFAPLLIAGSQRALILERADRFGDLLMNPHPSNIVVQNRRSAGQYEIAVTAPFEEWMAQSELILEERTYACGNRPLAYGLESGKRIYSGSNYTPEQIPAEPYRPVYLVSYITPEAEPVKTRGETYSARLTFPVAKSTLLPTFGDNARVLAEVDRILDEISGDELLTVNKIAVRGYASPEGNANSNYELSRNRAQAFVNYISRRNPALGRMASSQGMGEDWAGLRAAVEASMLPDRGAILSAIDHNYDDNRKEAAVKALSGGQTWRMLLNSYFPELRRNEYTIEYEVRGFNAEEAKRYVWSRPQLLSLNEFFLVSKLYAPGSREYREVIEIAARMFPDSPVAQMNTAAMEIENGSYDSAIARLSRVDSPEAWNNLGIAYWYKGDYAHAAEYLQKAARAGLADAAQNLEQYNRWSAGRQ